MKKHSRILLFLAALFGSLSVAIAAVGAHALHDKLLLQGQVETFAKGVDYAMYGALSLVAISALHQLLTASKFYLSGYLIALGTLLFSGSLLLATMADLQAVVIVTPWGGSLLILGWLSVGVMALLTKPALSSASPSMSPPMLPPTSPKT